jgi:hypothetical protein
MDAATLVTVLIISFFAFLIYIIPLIKIIRKAGYSGWWVLLAFVPLVNLVMFWVFAFSRWPAIERRAF